MTERYFDSEDRITARLGALYEGAGYRAYKIRKFEEYSLYLENRNFLTDDHIITFNDQNGRLLALKPDITLSIVKNKKASPGQNEKLYYRESVYRFDKHAHEYQEISQVGLEMIGKVGATEELETLQLALDSLSTIDQASILAISHMGYLKGVLNESGLGVTAMADALGAIGAKNPHDLRRILLENGVQSERADLLADLVNVPTAAALKQIAEALAETEETRIACKELFNLCDMLTELGYGDHIRPDFSVTNEVEYYHGIVFKGYVDGLARAVLSGGRYDKLAQKFTPGVGAIGFAVYLGELLYHQMPREFDTDILLLYSEKTSPAEVLAKAKALRADGKRVRVEPQIPAELRYREVIKL